MRIAWTMALCACSRVAPGTCDSDVEREPPQGGGGNVLIVLLDDVGVDQLSAYDMHPDPVPTPALETLAASGVRFDRAYASSSCSPTRASLLTGRHPSRTGVGWWMLPERAGRGLPDEEITLPEMLGQAPEPWQTALVGKWHLSPFDPALQPELAPLRQGFDRFVGVLGNLDSALTRHRVVPGQPELGYYHWERIDDGDIRFSDTWITAAQTNDALEVLQALQEPWLQLVSYSAAHAPATPPPSSWPETSPLRATIRDLDAEVGRLLQEIDLQDTTVFVLSDNGTAQSAIQPPWNPNRGKLTLFDGGVRVPLIAAGRGVTARGTVSDALVSVVDLFATVADLAGVDVSTLPHPVDGLSLRPWMEGRDEEGRKCVMVEHFNLDPGRRPRVRERAVLDRDHQYLEAEVGPRLYALAHSPGDQGTDDLRKDGTASSREVLDRLRREMQRYDRELPRP